VDSKRILITGISHYWGGRLAQALEAFPEIEAVIGVDNEEPQVELERTEYVKVGAQHALLRRVVEAAEIDTVVDARLVVDSAVMPSSRAHENNVMGTMNILAACSGPDSPVKKVVFKSSTHFYGCHQDDPAFFDETMRRPHPPRTGIERDIVEAEASLDEFAERNPDKAVTVLRFANVLGPDVETSHKKLFSLPVVPMILGFDPRYQFVHEDDVVHALEHAVKHRISGTYNVAGDGVLALSEVSGLLGKTYAPVLPPWGTGLATAVIRRIGIEIPPEALQQMRFGRGVDNRRYKAAGFHYQHTSRETVVKLGEHLRLHPVVRGAQEPYRYEREVEEFLRWSPHVKNTRGKAVSALSRSELAELRRLLTDFADTAGMDLGEDIPDRAAEAERRAAAAEEAAREAAERAGRAEQAAREHAAEAEEAAEARAAQAVEAAQARAADAEEAANRARAEAEERARAEAEERARAEAEERARAEAEERARAEAEERARQEAERAPARPPEHYDDLAAEEVIALLASLEHEDLQTLREYERDHANRARVLSAIDSVLARRGSRV
jgi:UDP-glucose 4-epimerase